MATLSAEDKISRAKIQLYSKYPFFSYLVEYLKVQEKKEVPSMGVDRYANCYYNREFIDSLDDLTMMGVLCHEVLHLAYKHPDRGKGREKIQVGGYSLWNVAIDIVVNYIVIKNNMKIPEQGIIPNVDGKGSVEIFNTTIEDIEDKSAEDIYELLKEAIKEQLNKQKQKGKGGNGDGEDQEGTPVSGFDEHDFEEKEGQGKDSKVSKAGESGEEVNWDSVIQVAANMAKQRGMEPAGLGREFDVYQKGYINWRNILHRIISHLVPHDHDWSRPDRRVIPFDIYLPHEIGETTKALIGIDTSGSISRDELSLFMTEIVMLSRQFSGIEVRVITHDAEVHDDYHVYNGNIQKIMNLIPHGGGGTDHNPLYEYIHEHKYDKGNNLLVSFTDGYSSYPDRPCIPTVFVLAGTYSVNEIPKWNRGIIELL